MTSSLPDDLCTEAVRHQNSLKHFLLSHLTSTEDDRISDYNDTTIVLADGQLRLNRIYLGLMFPGLGGLVNFDGRPEIWLSLPDFKRSDLLELARRILKEDTEEEIVSGNETLLEGQEDHGDDEITKECEGRRGIDVPNVLQQEDSVKSETLEEASMVKQHKCLKQSKQARVCSDCSESFSSRRALVEHSRKAHTKQRVVEKKLFPCGFCSEVYTRQDYLKVIFLKFQYLHCLRAGSISVGGIAFFFHPYPLVLVRIRISTSKIIIATYGTSSVFL
jgi:hypothetical protein